MTTKLSNPKDVVGTVKPNFDTIPGNVMLELGAAMLEGSLKYGAHNYRVAGVRAKIYYSAAKRHLTKFWDFGENTDPDSGISHITKAIACLVVLRDSMMMENWVDDRPPPVPLKAYSDVEQVTKELIERYPEPKQAFTALGN